MIDNFYNKMNQITENSIINLPTFLITNYMAVPVFLIKPEAKKNPPGKYNLLSGEELMIRLTSSPSSIKYVGINTKGFSDNDFLIDVDFPKNSISTVFLKKQFKNFLIKKLNDKNNSLSKCSSLIQETPNGLHLFCHGNFLIKNKTIFSELGVKFEVFSNNLNNNSNLTILGLEYGSFNYECFKHLSVENDIMIKSINALFYLTGILLLSPDTHVDAHITEEKPIPPSDIISVGERNNTLYDYAKIYNNKSLVLNLNDWATNEPLETDELYMTVLREDLYNSINTKNESRIKKASEKETKVLEKNNSELICNDINNVEILDPTMLPQIIYNPLFDISNLRIDAKIIFIFLKGSELAGNLVYIDSFYMYQGSENNLWKKDSGDFISKKAVSLMLQQPDANLAGYIISKKKLFFDTLASFVKITAKDFIKKSSFVGTTVGTLNKKVYPSKKEDYLTTILPYKLKRGEYNLDPYFIAVISAICGYSSERINLLRLAFYKLIFPDKESQQIVFLYGGPKTGKSSIADFIKNIHGDDMKAANFDALNKPFEASNLIHLKVIYIGDATYLKNVSELKKWQGRDFIQTERKFEHTNVSNCFSGTIFITSNYPPEKAIGITNDEALSSRLLAVPLEFVILQENPYFEGPFSLSKFLDKYKEDIIYWALTVPEALKEQPRADFLKYSGSESCYGSLKANLLYTSSLIPININQIGPIRQFLEERVKLTEHIKPIQKTLGYLFSKKISHITKNYFNVRIPSYGIKDFHTDNFRITELDILYGTEFFFQQKNLIDPEKKLSYSNYKEDFVQPTLMELYFSSGNIYKSPFSDKLVNFINPAKINTFYEGCEAQEYFFKYKKEFEKLNKLNKISYLSGKELFIEYINWLPVKPNENFKMALQGDFYNLFLDEILINLKGLFKYPFSDTLRTREGVSFLGIEWRDSNSWKALRESFLLRQFDPFYGQWMGVFEDGFTKSDWKITVKKCDNDIKHPMLQIDISFAEYFKCPAIFSLLEQFNCINNTWDNDNYIKSNLKIENNQVIKINTFTDDLSVPNEQIILSNYLDDNYEKLSPVSREYLLRSFVFHSSLIANRFDVNHGGSGSYLRSFFTKTEKHKSSIQDPYLNEGYEKKLQKRDYLLQNQKSPSHKQSIPSRNSDTPSQDSDSSSQNLESSSQISIITKESDHLDGKIYLKESNINTKKQLFPYNRSITKVPMKISEEPYSLFFEYDDSRINFIKNTSWKHLMYNYQIHLKGKLDTVTNREKFYVDSSVLNIDFSKINHVPNLCECTSISILCSSLKLNWVELKRVLCIEHFLSVPGTYYPETQYVNLNESIMLRPLMICFWENSLGLINKRLNQIFTENFLLNVQDKIKGMDSNTEIGERWADKKRNFLLQSFLPESAYYTLNNVDYGRLKFGKFYLKKLKTKEKPSVVGPYASQHKIFKKMCFQKLLNENLNDIWFMSDSLKGKKGYIYVLDIDLNKAHSNISYGLTQSKELFEMERVLNTKGWEGIFDQLDCLEIKKAISNSALEFDTVKKAIKAFYYKGIQGGELSSYSGVLMTLNGDPNKESPHKFSSKKETDLLLKKDLCDKIKNQIKTYSVKFNENEMFLK